MGDTLRRDEKVAVAGLTQDMVGPKIRQVLPRAAAGSGAMPWSLEWTELPAKSACLLQVRHMVDALGHGGAPAAADQAQDMVGRGGGQPGTEQQPGGEHCPAAP